MTLLGAILKPVALNNTHGGVLYSLVLNFSEYGTRMLLFSYKLYILLGPNRARGMTRSDCGRHADQHRMHPISHQLSSCLTRPMFWFGRS